MVRRNTTRRITVKLDAPDVIAAMKSMASCPMSHRDDATVTTNRNGTATVTWTEAPGEKKRRKDALDMRGQRFGQWEVLLEEPRLKMHPGGQQQTVWQTRCHGCGEVKEVDGGRLRAGKSLCCKECMRRFMTVPEADRICRFCDKKLAYDSKLAFQCVNCNRQRIRRGVCPCGKGVNYASKPCRRCDRVDGQEVA